MATIVMSAEKVIEAAEATIAGILAKRDLRDEETIQKWMQPRRTFWGKVKTRTREEAIKALDDYGNDSMWGWRSIAGWGDLDHAKKLLALAKHGDPVTLNENDVRVLF